MQSMLTVGIDINTFTVALLYLLDIVKLDVYAFRTIVWR